jgi:hypothetical protein
MAGRPSRKIFCESLRRDGQPCQAKGFPCANGKYLCRFHGYNNILGFKKPKYTDETRLKQLSKLWQFSTWSREKLEEYYYNKVKPTIINGGKSAYYRGRSHQRSIFTRNTPGQAVSVQLDEVLRVLKKKSRIRSEDT